MKAKKFFGNTLKYALLAVVATFLALHSINLFRFVFPADQQYLAWLGFGLTGFGAITYLVMFLWEGSTILQRFVSLGMAVVCSIGEVMAAIFGMQIESWKKAGFSLTENDFQTMLLVIGLLSVAHFLALIAYFAGDKIGELFKDDDGDGTPNYRDRDYYKNSNQKPQQPQHQNNNNQFPNWELPDFLRRLNITQQQAESIVAKSADNNQFYNSLKAYGIEKMQISGKNVKRLYYQIKQGQTTNP